MTAPHAVYGFLRQGIRKDLGKNHHAAGVSLKIACWITFVASIVVAVAGVLATLVAAFGRDAWQQGLRESDADPRFIDFATENPGFLAAIVLFATALAVCVLVLVLWWQNHTFMLWNAAADNALVWTNVLAAVMLALSLGGDGTNVVTLVLAILILVFANVAASRGELDGAGPFGTPASGTAGGAVGAAAVARAPSSAVEPDPSEVGASDVARPPPSAAEREP